MSKLEYPKCPYCDKKVSYLRSGYLISKSEYKCEACERASNVHVKHGVFGLVRVAFIVILIAVLIASFFRGFNPLEYDIIIITDIACMLMLPCYTELVAKENVEEEEEITEKEEPKI